MTHSPQFKSEAEFQAAITKLARRLGWLVFHATDPRRSPAGFPDLVLVRSGRIMLAELKLPTGKVTAKQAEWLAAGGEHAHIWRPADWSAIVAELTHR